MVAILMVLHVIEKVILQCKKNQVARLPVPVLLLHDLKSRLLMIIASSHVNFLILRVMDLRRVIWA